MDFAHLNISHCVVHDDVPLRDELIGGCLVLVASIGICLSLNLQKKVHMDNVDPVTELPRVHFTRLPLWWTAVAANGISELMNLAALGFAPATLVAPLGCLTVVFNSLTAVFWLGEPFLRVDILGLLLIFLGTACVIVSQLGSVSAPITANYLIHALHQPLCQWYLGTIALGMAVLKLYFEPGMRRGIRGSTLVRAPSSAL